jgi:2-oxoisovalerate dehydrogenase E1 component
MLAPEIYREALLIREFENLLLKLFSLGKLNGTVHTCVGQELTPVLLSKHLTKDDTVFSNHRGHGHYIAKTKDVKGLLAEIMGKMTGCSGGFGGSQHLYFPNEFYSNGIQGGMTPVAIGHAFSKRLSTPDGISVVFIGDGTLGEGILYETLNMAGIYNCPILFVLEHNKYAQSTSYKQTFSGNLKTRVEGFGINYRSASIWDIDSMDTAFREAISLVRGNSPTFIEIECYRLNSHSKGDDNRDPREIEFYAQKDLLNVYESENSAVAEKIKGEVCFFLQETLKEVEKSETLTTLPIISKISSAVSQFIDLEQEESDQRINDLINKSFLDCFANDETIVMLGEDIQSNNKFTPKEYGGAFKVTKNLSTLYPSRVLNAPISEAAMTGFCIGMALHGRKAIVEIMFGDFVTLTIDQLLQHASKFCAMFGRPLAIPVILRTPMGGKRGYGPTHSQSIEKMLLGIPHLNIIALNYRISPYNIYKKLLDNLIAPTIVIENKIDYTRRFNTPRISTHLYFATEDSLPILKITPRKIPPVLTVFTYGGVLADVEQAAEILFLDHEIAIEIICPSLISPVNCIPIRESVKMTKRLLTIEEGSSYAALGSEIIAQLNVTGLSLLKVAQMGNERIIPSSFSCEIDILPSKESIVSFILNMLEV